MVKIITPTSLLICVNPLHPVLTYNYCWCDTGGHDYTPTSFLLDILGGHEELWPFPATMERIIEKISLNPNLKKYKNDTRTIVLLIVLKISSLVGVGGYGGRSGEMSPKLMVTH